MGLLDGAFVVDIPTQERRGEDGYNIVVVYLWVKVNLKFKFYKKR